MSDAGFFRGTSSEQDNRFSDKEKKLLKQMKFADNLTTKVEMNKIKLDVLKPWISKRISELLGMEDDVVVEFVINQLEAEKNPDARKIQINLTGFLNGKNARIFTGELWGMLISAQESAVGIPASMVEAKKEEIRKRNEDQDRINETLKRTVSRFNDRIKQERQSPPPSNRRDRSPDISSRDRARSRSKDRDSKTSRPSTKPGDSDGKRSSPDNNSKGRDDSANQGKRNYRGRKSSSGSPESNNKRRSRSRSSSRERRSDKRPQRDLMEEIKERRGEPDRGRGGRDNRDRPRRSRSPVQRPNKRSRSRSPLRGRSRRSPSPLLHQGNFRRRLPAQDLRFRQGNSHRDRDPPPKRDSSAERHRKQDDRRSRSRTPPTRDGRVDADNKKSSARLLPDLQSNFAPPNNKTVKRSATPEPLLSSRSKNISKSGSSSEDNSSSSSDRETDKPEKSISKRKASASDDSSNSGDDQPKKRKDKKKKKDKKHKKHKKHKKLKKSKKHSSENDEEDGSQEEDENKKLSSSRIAKSFLKLVEPHKDKAPSSEDLERKLREKALMSMKKASATLNR